MSNNTYVVMTAMPPTRGHIELIDYARNLSDTVVVMLMTQPGEPFPIERYETIRDTFNLEETEWYDDQPHATGDGFTLHWIHRTIEQDPEAPGFRELWRQIMQTYGCGTGDTVVASETYGKWLAEITGARFMPYDPYREITPVKATNVRFDPVENFHLIAREFQPYLRKDITIFGAESTGKTTLAKDLALHLNGHFFMEWARPYLEVVGSEISIVSMTDIWHGQAALEAHSGNFYDKPFAFFDTDLYSTIGYWGFPHWYDTIGPVPQGLIDDACPSDLYLICQSNIPFEEDPLRYGGDHREGSDEYWINIAEKYSLPYIVLQEYTREGRIEEAAHYIDSLADDMRQSITYDRGGF